MRFLIGAAMAAALAWTAAAQQPAPMRVIGFRTASKFKNPPHLHTNGILARHSLIVILGKALSALASGNPDDRVIIQVVIGRAAKRLNPNGSFLKIDLTALKRFVDYKVQEVRIAAAVAEVRAALNALQLLLDHLGSNSGFTECFVQHREPPERESSDAISSPLPCESIILKG
jgi:hypothetical protein